MTLDRTIPRLTLAEVARGIYPLLGLREGRDSYFLRSGGYANIYVLRNAERFTNLNIAASFLIGLWVCVCVCVCVWGQKNRQESPTVVQRSSLGGNVRFVKCNENLKVAKNARGIRAIHARYPNPTGRYQWHSTLGEKERKRRIRPRARHH